MSYWVLEKRGHPSGPHLAQPKPAGRSIQTTLNGFCRRRPSSSPRARSSESGRGTEELFGSKEDEAAPSPFAEPGGQHVKRKRLPSPSRDQNEVGKSAFSKASQGPLADGVHTHSNIASSLYDSENSEVSNPHELIKRKIKRRRKRWGDATCAPAISPKKRKSLIEQSAKDMAAQQHCPKARAVLSPIENTHESYSHQSPGSRKDRGAGEGIRSPLRQGFSIVQVGPCSDVDSDSDSGPSSPLLAKSSSPVKEACEHRVPGTKTRVLVLETQLANAGLGEPETSVEGDIEELTEASQTATEESWPGSQSQSQVKGLDSNARILRHPAGEDEEEGDITIVPDLQVAARDEETQLLPWDEEEMGESVIGSTVSSSRTQRTTKAWKDINRLWFPYLTDDREPKVKKPDQAKQSSLGSFGYWKKATHQRNERSPSPMSEGEDVPSDLEDLAPIDAIPHDPSSGTNRLTFAVDESVYGGVQALRDSQDAHAPSSSSETQSLPWDDDLSNRSSDEGNADEISIPSDTGLDTQMRQFFAQL